MLVLISVLPTLPGELVIGGLGSPRGLALDANGNLLVAVAGTGGKTSFTLESLLRQARSSR